MQQKNDTISFIIVNYNSEKELYRCLNDLKKINNTQKFEIIVINNDKKPLSISKNIFDNQIIHEVGKNIGYGRASNIGLSLASGKFVCFLNPDTHSFCDNLYEITTHIKNKKTIITPQIRTKTNDIEPWSVGENISLYQIFKNHCKLNKKLWLNDNITTVDWVSGAAMIGTRDFFQELSGFDEEYFLYFEDVDLCKRASIHGGNIKYIPSFYITHANGSSSKTNKKRQKKYYYDSQDLFFNKHYGAQQARFLRFCRFFKLK